LKWFVEAFNRASQSNVSAVKQGAVIVATEGAVRELRDDVDVNEPANLEVTTWEVRPSAR
jgi:hypothetical protein